MHVEIHDFPHEGKDKLEAFLRLILKTTQKKARYIVQTIENEPYLERIVHKTERSLLQEVLEWHSITSFAESH